MSRTALWRSRAVSRKAEHLQGWRAVHCAGGGEKPAPHHKWNVRVWVKQYWNSGSFFSRGGLWHFFSICTRWMGHKSSAHLGYCVDLILHFYKDGGLAQITLVTSQGLFLQTWLSSLLSSVQVYGRLAHSYIYIHHLCVPGRYLVLWQQHLKTM